MISKFLLWKDKYFACSNLLFMGFGLVMSYNHQSCSTVFFGFPVMPEGFLIAIWLS
jgi:hypothetical protein